MFRTPVPSVHRSRSPRPLAGAAVVALAVVTAGAGGAQVVSRYVGPPMGSWNVPANWSPFGVPGNGGGTTFFVLIDGAEGTAQDSRVVLDSDPTIDGMEIWPGDELLIPNGRWLAIAGGGLSNRGRLTMASTGSGTDLRLDESVLLGGDGELVMGDRGSNIIRNNFGPPAWLTNGANHTIRGSGQLGVDTLLLTNHGLIRADQPTELHVNLRSEEVNVNAGTMEAADGALLRLYHSGTLDNVAGLIRANDASTVVLEGTHVVGGTITTVGSGLVSVDGATPLLEDVLNTGLLGVPNGRSLALRGTIRNDAVIRLEAAGNGTDFRVDSDEFLLTGRGSLLLSDDGNNVVRNNFGSTTHLTHDDAHTIRGSGSLGWSSLRITNRGSIIADSSPGLSIDPHDSVGFDNRGVVHVTGAGSALLHWGGFTTSGSVVVDAGCTLTRNGAYDQTAGTTVVNGSLQVNAGAMHLKGGTLAGAGTIDGAVFNTAGVVAPGTSAGTLSIHGGYQQDVDGLLDIELGGFRPRDNDVLAVTGAAHLSGTLAVAVRPGFHPTPGTSFTILQTTGGSITGQFTRIVPCRFTATYTADTVTITVGGTVPADLNCDGFVNGGDLAIMLGSWGECASADCPADLNDDGVVNGSDLAILLGAWG